MKKIFKYTHDDNQYKEFEKDNRCEVLGFTDRPFVWTLNYNTKRIVAVNPSELEFVGYFKLWEE